jgi:hypothetical protein
VPEQAGTGDNGSRESISNLQQGCCAFAQIRFGGMIAHIL